MLHDSLGTGDGDGRGERVAGNHKGTGVVPVNLRELVPLAQGAALHAWGY